MNVTMLCNNMRLRHDVLIMTQNNVKEFLEHLNPKNWQSVNLRKGNTTKQKEMKLS